MNAPWVADARHFAQLDAEAAADYARERLAAEIAADPHKLAVVLSNTPENDRRLLLLCEALSTVSPMANRPRRNSRSPCAWPCRRSLMMRPAMKLRFETKNARQVTLASVSQPERKAMQTKIVPLPQRRRNPVRATTAALAAELRQIRRELAELREQVKALTPPAPWGLGDRQ